MTHDISWVDNQTISFDGILFYALQKHPGYYVSESGQIFGIKRSRILGAKPTKEGYRRFSPDGKYISAHRAICEHFHSNPENKPWVNHKDGDKGNNAKDNLEWSTISENIQHSYDVLGRQGGQWSKGRKHSVETKAIMSAKKLGELHPKFKGWYITPAGRFPSSYQAGRANNLEPKVVFNRCKGKQAYRWMWKGWAFEHNNLVLDQTN